MIDDPIEVSVDETIATVRINRLSERMRYLLRRPMGDGRWDRIEADNKIRRHFIADCGACASLDLKEAADRSREMVDIHPRCATLSTTHARAQTNHCRDDWLADGRRNDAVADVRSARRPQGTKVGITESR